MAVNEQTPVKRVHEVSVQKLREGLRDPSSATPEESARGFQRFQRVVQSLPLTSSEFCFACNWIASARDLWARGEYAAAHYQIDLAA